VNRALHTAHHPLFYAGNGTNITKSLDQVPFLYAFLGDDQRCYLQ